MQFSHAELRYKLVQQTFFLHQRGNVLFTPRPPPEGQMFLCFQHGAGCCHLLFSPTTDLVAID